MEGDFSAETGLNPVWGRPPRDKYISLDYLYNTGLHEIMIYHGYSSGK